VKTLIVAVGLFTLMTPAWADELEDQYAALKAAVEKKEAETVRKLSADVAKMARATLAAPQTGEEGKQKADFAKDVLTYTEYALAATATAPGMDSGKVVELIDQLEAENSKSKYLDTSAIGAYVKALDGLARNLSAKSPDRALAYANKLLALKTKPEPVPEADWERIKAAAAGSGYYLAGLINGQKQVWVDCNRDLSAALPFIEKDQAELGVAYFQLGLCDYQLGRLTQDRSKIIAGQKYSEMSAAIPGPYRSQAATNAAAMKAELAGPTKR